MSAVAGAEEDCLHQALRACTQVVEHRLLGLERCQRDPFRVGRGPALGPFLLVGTGGLDGSQARALEQMRATMLARW